MLSFLTGVTILAGGLVRQPQPVGDEAHGASDSRAVHVTDATAGFERRRGKPRSLDLIYVVGDEALYDLELRE